jgi:integrase/recombinase XerD
MTVSLTKRVKTSNGMRYCTVVTAANGRIAQDMVLVNGKAERHTEGAYYIEWHVKGIRKRLSVGTNATDAAAKKHKQEQLLGARAVGLTVEEPKKGRLLVNAAAAYLAEIEAQKKNSTYKSYRVSINYFVECCTKRTLEEIDRSDLMHFLTFLRKKFSAYTVFQKFMNALIFLKSQGIVGLIGKDDWPPYTLEEPETYEAEDLQKFFSACTKDEQLLFHFFLYTGMRDREVAHTTWKSINFATGEISVKHNPEYDWTPKAYTERTIPVPQKLMDDLKAKKRTSTSDLAFPADCGKPKRIFYSCKAIAKRAGLNQKDWHLHKFRATFATMQLQNGFDVRTVMSWMGHTDIQSTMRYLKPNRSQLVRDRVETTFTAF